MSTSTIDTETLENSVQTGVNQLLRGGWGEALKTILFALLLLVICLVIKAILLKLLDRGLNRFSQVEKSLHTFIRSMANILLWFITLMVVADSLGINVYKMRYAGVLISGFLGGVGGLAYTLAAGSGFNSDVGGYGFLALAVMIFGNWKPLPILGASLFFALFKVIAALNATLTFLPKFEGVKEISNFYQMLPYIVTMIVLIFTSKNSQAPKAEGIPYDKGSR